MINLKKIKFWLGGLLVAIFLSPAVAKACEPCAETLAAPETAAAADLVIVGHKVDESSPTPVNSNEVSSDPEWIEVVVREVLKGKVAGDKIKIHSYDGMCPYGIVINDQRDYLMMLSAAGQADLPYQYDAVKGGCATRVMPVEDNEVSYGDQWINLNELASSLGLTDYQGSGSQSEEKGSLFPLLYLPLGVISVVVVLIILKPRRRPYGKD